MGDGSVRFINDTIDPRVWIAVNSMAAGDVTGLDL
jgi:hypothetical protein